MTAERYEQLTAKFAMDRRRVESEKKS